MNVKTILRVSALVCATAVAGRADTLELKNGSLIRGKFLSGTQTSISFQVGSSVQNYDVADISSLRFEGNGSTESSSTSSTDLKVRSSAGGQVTTSSAALTLPAGTRLSIRTIDEIDSTKNGVGYRFRASLEQALWIDGKVVVSKGADVYGRLAESRQTGTFAGRSELKVELTGMVVNGQTLPLVTGEYEVSGKSKGESTAKRSLGGAAIGSIIGALAGGGKGAAIGAGAGAGAGVASEVITKGDQVRIPSETLLEFTLEQSVTIPTREGVSP
jgi:hypothetical protein